MTQDTNPNFKVYLDDGIVYYEFTHELSIDIILAAEKTALELMAAHNILIVPTIIIFRDIDSEKVDISVLSLSRIITHHDDVMKFASGLWFVGATGQIRKLAGILNTMFMNSRVQFVDTLAEAQAAAQAAKSQDVPLLEQ